MNNEGGSNRNVPERNDPGASPGCYIGQAFLDLLASSALECRKTRPTHGSTLQHYR